MEVGLNLGWRDWRLVGLGAVGDLRHCVGAVMIIDLPGAQLLVMDGYSAVVADMPYECTRCHRMTHFFENRDGRTSCTACAVEKGYSR